MVCFNEFLPAIFKFPGGPAQPNVPPFSFHNGKGFDGAFELRRFT